MWNNKKIKIMFIGLIAIISTVLLFNQPIKQAMIHSFHPEITAKTINKNNKGKAKYNYKEVKRLTISNIASARANAKSIKIIGIISIPDEQLTLPISKGISNQNLALSAGTFRPNMKMGKGNYALAGHNMSNLGPKILFSPLYYKGKIGQKIYVTDLKKIYEYKIEQKQMISKYDTQVIEDTPQKLITLITCDETGARRLMVRGSYVKSMTYKHAPKSVRKAISQKYNVD